MLLVRLAGIAEGREQTGWGEAPTRRRVARATREATWHAAGALVRSLEGVPISGASPTDSVRAVRETVRALAKHAERDTDRQTVRRVLVGVESALLDLVGRVQRLPLADLLTAERSPVSCLNPTVELTGDRGADRRAIRERCTPDGVNWVVPRATFPVPEAEDLIVDLAAQMRSGSLQAAIVLGQPVRATHRDSLAELQRRADRELAGTGMDLRVMASGSSVTSRGRLETVTAEGGCRALLLDPARIGGPLGTLDLAQRAKRRDPDTLVAIDSSGSDHELGARTRAQTAAAIPHAGAVRCAHGAADPCGPELVAADEATGHGTGLTMRFGDVIDGARRYARRPVPRPPVLHGQQANTYPDAEILARLSKAGIRSHLVEREALAHGLSTTRYTAGAFIATGSTGSPMLFGAGAHAPLSTAAPFLIADHHKGAAHALLARAGVPVPDGQVFAASDVAGATAFAMRIGYPVVVKPVAGTGGRAVTTNISSDGELAEALALVGGSRFAGQDVQVERHLPGSMYRIVVLDGRVNAALLREPASVTGDGVRSVAELVVEKNSYRWANPRLRSGPVTREDVERHLAGTGDALERIPAAGERRFVGGQTYLAAGGDMIDVLDELHPSISDAAVRAVETIPGLRFCGIDILLDDHREPIDQQQAGICELNAGPELITPQYPLFGTPAPVAWELLAAVARRHGVTLAEPSASELSLHIVVRGWQLGKRYRNWFHARAAELELICEAGGEGDIVEVKLCGETSAVAAMASLAVTGPPDARPVSVTTQVITQGGDIERMRTPEPGERVGRA